MYSSVALFSTLILKGWDKSERYSIPHWMNIKNNQGTAKEHPFKISCDHSMEKTFQKIPSFLVGSSASLSTYFDSTFWDKNCNLFSRPFLIA